MRDRATVAVVDDAARILMVGRRLPGGFLDPEVDPPLSAAWLVEEATGWRPRSLTPVLGCEVGLVFLARGADRTDVEPTIVPAWVPLGGVPVRLARNEFTDAATVIGLLAALVAQVSRP